MSRIVSPKIVSPDAAPADPGARAAAGIG